LIKNIRSLTIKKNRIFSALSPGEKTLKFVNKYFSKGKRIIIHGELCNDNYSDTNGIKHYNNVIIAENIEFADTKANSEQQNGDYNNYSNSTIENFAIPGEENIITDGDVPF
jgi:single-strand DNA-binding protein